MLALNSRSPSQCCAFSTQLIQPQAQLSYDDIRSLLTYGKSGVIRISANVLRRNAQIRNLQSRYAVHVQISIHDTQLLTRRHLGGPYRMPRRLDLFAQRLLEDLVVLRTILQISELRGVLLGVQGGTSRLGIGRERRMVRCELATVHGCAPEDLPRLLINPHLHLDVHIARIAKESNVEVQPIADLRPRYVEVASRVRV